MPPSPLLIHQVQDATVVSFRTSAILDSSAIEAIARDLYALVDEQAVRKLVLDFESVNFLSSQALGMLITLKNKADAIKGRVVLCGMKDDLKKVFKIMKLTKMFSFYENEQRALASFDIYTA